MERSSNVCGRKQYFNVPPQKLPGWTEENQKEPQDNVQAKIKTKQLSCTSKKCEQTSLASSCATAIANVSVVNLIAVLCKFHQILSLIYNFK